MSLPEAFPYSHHPAVFSSKRDSILPQQPDVFPKRIFSPAGPRDFPAVWKIREKCLVTLGAIDAAGIFSLVLQQRPKNSETPGLRRHGARPDDAIPREVFF